MPRRIFPLLAAIILSGAGAPPARGATWEVGPGRELTGPSQAAARVRDGDTVLIDAGDYADCAVWRANGLTIQGRGTVTLDGPVCQGKALFVVEGRDTVIRGIGFAHARAPDGNGAGIRGEGVNLTIEDSRFTGNQDGLLANDNAGSTITIANSVFTGNGVCNPMCAHGIYVNHVAMLRVRGSTFTGQMQGHHIKSRAAKSEITGNTIRDGADGTASYAVDIPDGGGLVLTGNSIQKGPRAGNRVVVSIGEENTPANPPGALVIQDNTVTADGAPSIFVRNVTAVPAQLRGNLLKGAMTALNGPGQVAP